MITFFLVLLALSGLVDVGLGLWAIFGWGSFTQTFLGQTVLGGDLQMMGFLLGLVLLFFAYLQAQALWWIRQEDDHGYRLALGFAGFLIVSSALMYVRHPSMPIFLAVDGVRGVLLAVFGAIAMRTPLTISRLGLPTGHRARSRRVAPAG
ncbi:MAG: hypothetical protein GF355_09075, partial [Candidatus Eisenbacteria bacterium]|nr:hypothetical protein [Candidatus Eisenbacteria bacterium]